MRSKKLALLALPATAVLALVVGLGLSSGTAAVSAPPVAPTSGAPAGTKATAEDAKAFRTLVDKVYGTPAQRRKGEEWVNHKLDQNVRSCMAKAGFGYDGAEFRGHEVQAAIGGYDLVAPLGDFHQASWMRVNAQSVQARNAQTNRFKANDKTGYDKAVDACNQAEARMPYAGNARPDSRKALSGNIATAEQLAAVPRELERKVAELQVSATAQDLLAGYRNCLAQRGYNVKSWGELYHLVESKFRGMETTAWPQLSQSAAWAAAVKFEDDASAADKACRTDIVSWTIASLRSVVDAFLADPRVAQLTDGWKAIDTDAVQAGLS